MQLWSQVTQPCGMCDTQEINRTFSRVFDLIKTLHLPGQFGLAKLAANYLLCGLVLTAVTATHDSVWGVELHNPVFPFLGQKPAAFVFSANHKTYLLCGFTPESSKSRKLLWTAAPRPRYHMTAALEQQHSGHFRNLSRRCRRVTWRRIFFFYWTPAKIY